jgi:hypothetical protein
MFNFCCGKTILLWKLLLEYVLFAKKEIIFDVEKLFSYGNYQNEFFATQEIVFGVEKLCSYGNCC